jgi:hypothetical protein
MTMTLDDKGALESLRPTSKVSRAKRFQIAFGNQTFSSGAWFSVWGRLSALRPYLAAGLPLSVQSYLKELA